MSLGLPSGLVLVAPYDEAWPALFVAECARVGTLRDDAGIALPLVLEHTGSTSVPGLDAKPVLDILGGYPAGETVSRYVEAMERAGYEHRGEQGIPGRAFFRRGSPRAFHLHLTVIGGPFWTDHLRFRDALRADDALRDQYARLKHALAARHRHDRPSYTDGKADFVRAVLARGA